jgi:phosphatidylinositol glycan class V
MIFVLIRSGWEVMRVRKEDPRGAYSSTIPTEIVWIVRVAAFSQLFLAGLAVLNHHVQVITRLSSGYPIWYMWLAGKLIDGKSKMGMRITYFMIMYASIQAVLFASFLPPA